MHEEQASSVEGLTRGGEQIKGGSAGPQGAHRAAATPKRSLPEPTVLTLQDLLDLPKQILPEETYFHLQNATREAALTLYSIWRHISSSLEGDSKQKVRKRIDVE